VDQFLELARQVARRLQYMYRWLAEDDVYSYALLGTSRALDVYDPARSSCMRGFVSQQARFMAIDEMRKDGTLRRHKSRFQNVPLPADLTCPESEDGAGQAPERAELRDSVEFLLKHIADKDRRLLLMYYADGMNFREIGAVLGRNESTICIRHKNLLERLRRLAHRTGMS
jgi:RNA polymerase sigma factor (sigma-70 family)